jgi:hypothetical protein
MRAVFELGPLDGKDDYWVADDAPLALFVDQLSQHFSALSAPDEIVKVDRHVYIRRPDFGPDIANYVYAGIAPEKETQ